MRLATSLAVLIFLVGLSPAAAADPDEADALAVSIHELTLARSYKYKGADSDTAQKYFHKIAGAGAAAEIESDAAKYADLLENFEKKLEATRDPGQRTPRELFLLAIGHLRALTHANPHEKVLCRLRDAVAEFIEGESLMGSDDLIDALRSRFPKVKGSAAESKPAKAKPTESDALLKSAADHFQAALDQLAQLATWPALLRDGTSSGDQFGRVENSDGQEVLNELHLALGVIERRARTLVEYGKLLFNRSALSRAKGEEQLIQEARQEAAGVLKQAGQEGYLWLATSAALHDEPTSFTRNGAGEVRAQLGIANCVFQMIRRGENPDGYVKDFVPSRRCSEVYQDAVNKVVEAYRAEVNARDSTRAFDDNLGKLRTELTDQRRTYVEALDRLCGVKVEDGGGIVDIKSGGRLQHNIRDLAGRRKFMQYVRDRINGHIRSLLSEMIRERKLDADKADLTALPQIDNAEKIEPYGEIAVQLLELRAANLALFGQVHEFKSYAERVQVEESRVNKVAEVTFDGQSQIGAKQVAMGWANSVTITVTALGPTLCFNPNSVVSGYLQRDISNVQANMTVRVDQANSEAVVKNLLIDQHRAFNAISQAENRVLQAQAALNNLLSQVERRLEDWARAQDEAADLYVRFPQFRIERDNAIVLADETFRRAREACYFAAKALEYEWVEAYSNPIAAHGSGQGPSLDDAYKQFARIESLFGVQNSVELKKFLQALYEWDKRLTTDGLRGAPRQPPRPSTMISVRQDLWGYHDNRKADDQTDKEQVHKRNIALFQQRLQRQLVRRNNTEPVALAFEFATQIDNSEIFNTTEWNQKIVSLAVGFLYRDSLGPGVTNPMAEVIQGGTSSIRRFPPRDQNIARLSLSGLGPDELNRAVLDPSRYRTYLKLPVVLWPSEDGMMAALDKAAINGLTDLSVAADRWTFIFDLANEPVNRGTRLENLTDIVFMFKYTFNRPDSNLGTELLNAQAALTEVR